MSTLKVTNLQNPASGVINGTLNADGTSTFGGSVTFAASQTFPTYTGATAPPAPVIGLTWYDTALAPAAYKIYDGAAWTILSNGSSGTVTQVDAGTGLTGGPITTTGTLSLDTAYTDTLYLSLAGGTMTGDITFSGTQTFPNVLPLAGGTMTGDIVFAGTQTFPNAVSSITAGTGLLGGAITTSGTIDLNTAFTDGLYLTLTGGTMTGDITFAGTQTFPGVLELAGGTMTGDITFAGTQTFPNTATVVAAPTSSADPGNPGDVAVAPGFFYFYDGTQWLQVAGSPF